MTHRPTRILPVAQDAPDPAVLRTAADVIRAGGLVAFPTETVYGLGANALSGDAVRGVFAAKGRPAGNPLIVHVSDDRMLRDVVAAWPETARRLAARFWPGPLTLVVPRGPGVPVEVTGGGPTVAVRMPAHPVALALIRAAGVPLAAPSANRSSELSPTRAEHVAASLDGRIDLILDGGPTPNGLESTVLDLTVDPPVLLRPGPVPVAELESVIGPLGRRGPPPSAGPLRSPGMLPRHYAPRTPLELWPTRAALEGRARQLAGRGEAFAAVLLGAGEAASWAVALPPDPVGYAARLYDVLHDLDGRGVARILVELPPDTPGWLAVRDRLTRAATP